MSVNATSPVYIKEGTIREGLTQGIVLHDWKIISKKAPICSSSEMEKIQQDFGLPPPEMVFGNNLISLEKGEFKICFTAYDALSKVDTSSTSSENLKVAYAEEWTRKSAMNHTDIKDVVKPYDWSYTTDYRGTCPAQFESSETSMINIERLKRPEPILFYDENILYEDELADNGTAMLTIRLRVMPSCFLVLQRFFMRVDNVLFRINDTRLYHEFGNPYLIREYTSKEAHFNDISEKIGKGDTSLLNDQNWVSSVMPDEAKTVIREKIKL
ncbi:TIP41-domain-containing protein [Rhizopus microsporus]|uniref:TIP41-domain-containing protein n=1 Tax=Rhizopus microsporus TaxID=58291 RepID=A0A1X0RYQ9_RHIZD|nr:TIP41-domain-containing protein [Rhizopus microsporus]